MTSLSDVPISADERADSAPQQEAEPLAYQLEELAASSIARLRQVLDLPLNYELTEDQGRTVRSIIAAATTGLNTQLRADTLRLRAARQDTALASLLSLLREKERSVPSSSVHSLVSHETI